MKPETLFRKKVVAWIRENLKNVYVLSVQQIALRGSLDLMLCISGHFVALELKAKGGRLSDLQRYHIDKIVSAGGTAIEVHPDNWDDIKPILLNLYLQPKERLNEN